MFHALTKLWLQWICTKPEKLFMRRQCIVSLSNDVVIRSGLPKPRLWNLWLWNREISVTLYFAKIFILWNAGACLKSCETFSIKRFRLGCYLFLLRNYFRKNSPPQLLEWFLNMSLNHLCIEVHHSGTSGECKTNMKLLLSRDVLRPLKSVQQYQHPF